MTSEDAVPSPAIEIPPDPAEEIAVDEPHTLLIVDDSPLVLSMLADLLEGEGYRVQTAANGGAALARIDADPPDLVLLDVMMPETDGYEVCRILRRREGEYIPVLMLTAAGDLVESLAAGADDFIDKPPNHVELLARIRSLLRVRTLQRRLFHQNSDLQVKNQQLEEQNRQLEVMAVQLEAQNHELVAMARELEELNRELEFQACTDSLTRAYNRHYLHERLQSEFARARRHGQPLSCAILDIDHFKAVNDTHGHLAGDQVLARLVELIRAKAREEDVVARYGGEEFVLLLPETGAGHARHLVERVRAAVEAESVLLPHGGEVRVTVSIGLADFDPQDGTHRTPDDLLRAADQALYRAKNRGRNRIEIA